MTAFKTMLSDEARFLGKKSRPSQVAARWAQPDQEKSEAAMRQTEPADQRGGAESLHLASFEDQAEPYSLQWFLGVEERRYGRRSRWLPELLEFGKHDGETVLGLGEGLGTDWLQFARHGAHVICCQPKGGDLALVRKNFELRGVAGRFLQAAPAHLPLPSESVDVVCVNGLLNRHPEPERVAAELFRVLKPGGKALAIVPARCYPWVRWLRKTPPAPRSQTFSRRQLLKLFPQFAEHNVHKRHLRRRDYRWACRWLPRPLLERLIGEFFVLRCFKPVRVAEALRLAA